MPPMPLLPCQRSRLVKILGLTGSPHPGEVVAAAAAAHRILSAAGATWDSVIITPTAPTTPPPDDDTADADIEWCLRNGDGVLTDWDRRFLVSLQGFSRYSDKQKAVLSRIVAKCQRSKSR